MRNQACTTCRVLVPDISGHAFEDQSDLQARSKYGNNGRLQPEVNGSQIHEPGRAIEGHDQASVIFHQWKDPML